MMVKPPLKKLESQVDSKYTLVTLAAKRARELTDGEPCLAESTHATDKPVSLAFYEIAEGEVTYKRTKEGINQFLVSMIQGIFKRRRTCAENISLSQYLQVLQRIRQLKW